MGMTHLTPEKRAKLREGVSQEPNLEAVYWHIGGVTLRALLDAADERDRLAAAIEHARRVHTCAECVHRDGCDTIRALSDHD